MDFIVLVLFGLIFYVGLAMPTIFGNAIICYVIFKNRSRSTTYLLLASQCLSDLLLGVIIFGMPFCFEPIAKSHRGFKLMCELCTVHLQFATFFISNLSMLAIAVYRFYVLFINDRSMSGQNQKIKKTMIVIVLIWLISLLMGLCFSVGFHFPFYTKDITNISASCFTIYEELIPFVPFTQRESFWFVWIVTTDIPFVLSLICYSLIAIRLKRISVDNEYVDSQRKRTIKVMIMIFIVYYVLTGPASFLDQFETYYTGKAGYCTSQYHVATMVAVIVARLASVANPFILYFYDDGIRKSFSYIFNIFSSHLVSKD